MYRTVYIWTQYYEDAVIRSSEAAARYFEPNHDMVASYEGREITLHYRNYLSSETDREKYLFAGGDGSYSYWLEKPDIMFILERLGFTEITMGVDNPHHGPGPACFFLARRPGSRDARG